MADPFALSLSKGIGGLGPNGRGALCQVHPWRNALDLFRRALQHRRFAEAEQPGNEICRCLLRGVVVLEHRVVEGLAREGDAVFGVVQLFGQVAQRAAVINFAPSSRASFVLLEFFSIGAATFSFFGSLPRRLR